MVDQSARPPAPRVLPARRRNPDQHPDDVFVHYTRPWSARSWVVWAIVFVFVGLALAMALLPSGDPVDQSRAKSQSGASRWAGVVRRAPSGDIQSEPVPSASYDDAVSRAREIAPRTAIAGAQSPLQAFALRTPTTSGSNVSSGAASAGGRNAVATIGDPSDSDSARNPVNQSDQVGTNSAVPDPIKSPVIEAQRRLSALGYDIGPIDGVIGRRSRAAILAWQIQAGLATTGSVDDALLTSLRRAGARTSRPSGTSNARGASVRGTPNLQDR